MNLTDTALMEKLSDHADRHFDGHFTIMKFTTNWRVCFGTPDQGYSYEKDDIEMAEGKTFQEAASKALLHPRWASCITGCGDLANGTALSPRRRHEALRKRGYR